MGDADRDILELIEEGEKIRAIKLAREHLGMGLAEAKEFVEGLERDARAGRLGGGGDAGGAGADAGPLFDDEIDGLLRAKKKIEAVKLYRARVGGGLKDAKDAVERRAVEIGLQSRPSKCFIATAAWGGGEQAEVASLRRFRNRVLRRRRWGRAVIGVYERVSPPLALLVESSELLGCMVRGAVRAAGRPLVLFDRGAADRHQRGV